MDCAQIIGLFVPTIENQNDLHYASRLCLFHRSFLDFLPQMRNPNRLPLSF
ncbi:hypothetical protein HBZS_109830 [Helicobacter bizzozeronii CCUG 35545]|nr:hypothetical protein HBZS_109830 [Helicobacter bizzozeronii CCUG 35545]